ncbi:MAG: hypothetical protein Ct9H300mP21_00420 [Pseudomonadota bacterium]|nr:MAG: hypothetical protein Ct9H300mP21_00420 [Pseudomonadota bacterium]
MLHSDRFRIYRSTDLVGYNWGVSIKNVIAIASGIADGMQLGLNARAALICRGLRNVPARNAMGGSAETFMGMPGIGDLVLTATGNLSRNHNLGEKLGQGFSLEDCFPSGGAVQKGYVTRFRFKNWQSATKLKCQSVTQFIKYCIKGVSCTQALQKLLERDRPDEEIMSRI